MANSSISISIATILCLTQINDYTRCLTGPRSSLNTLLQSTTQEQTIMSVPCLKPFNGFPVYLKENPEPLLRTDCKVLQHLQNLNPVYLTICDTSLQILLQPHSLYNSHSSIFFSSSNSALYSINLECSSPYSFIELVPFLTFWFQLKYHLPERLFLTTTHTDTYVFMHTYTQINMKTCRYRDVCLCVLHFLYLSPLLFFRTLTAI